MGIGRHVAFPEGWVCGQHALVAVTCLILGVAVVQAPPVAWALVGAIMGLVLFQFPAYAWVSAAILAAVLSRWFVAIGVVPPILNFFHFPLAVGAALVAATRGVPRFSVARSIALGCIALLVLSFVSWAFNGGEVLRPPLTWLVFLEPFLIIYALVRMPPPVSKEQLLWKVALMLLFVQFPLALWQALTLGLSDYVQGTFVGMGAGHHVLGGVALIGTLICVARALSAATFRKRLTWLLGGMILFLIPVLSDAKQNIVAFLPAMMLLLMIFRVRWTRLAVVLAVLIIAIVAAFVFHRPLQGAANSATITRGMLAKTQGLTIIATKLFDNPGGWLFGLGPGNSISRVALMGTDEYIKVDSPVAVLGLSAASTTQEVWALASSNWMFSDSSVWSGISSWLGLLGDLGLVGLGLYLWMSWKMWHYLRGAYRWQIGAAKSVLVMTAFLGVIYSWLEEPGYTLMSALIVGLGLLSAEEKDAPTQDLARPQFVPVWWR